MEFELKWFERFGSDFTVFDLNLNKIWSLEHLKSLTEHETRAMTERKH